MEAGGPEQRTGQAHTSSGGRVRPLGADLHPALTHASPSLWQVSCLGHCRYPLPPREGQPPPGQTCPPPCLCELRVLWRCAEQLASGPRVEVAFLPSSLHPGARDELFFPASSSTTAAVGKEAWGTQACDPRNLWPRRAGKGHETCRVCRALVLLQTQHLLSARLLRAPTLT